MTDFLFQYGLFLAKSLTFLIAFLIAIAGLFAIIQKAKKEKESGTLIISDLNEKYADIRKCLQSEMLSKKEWKKWLKAQKQNTKEEKKESISPRLYVLRFNGDIRASEVTHLREIISAIIEIAESKDEVLILLESSGGFVHGYGLAASQLERLRQHQIVFTVAIDKCAASGGYLMACVANKILAAPFAIIGSIGVVAQLPNFHRFLNKHNIDFEMQTAGEYKRTLTLFGENTPKARAKFQEELEETHALFKNFIIQHRPQIDIDKVATGEHWHASIALKLNLIDEILTSDDFILNKISTHSVFEISYEIKQSFTERFSMGMLKVVENILSSFSFRS